MSIEESIRFLAGRRYIRNLATLVISYGMAINIVEVTWKGRLRQAFPVSYVRSLGLILAGLLHSKCKFHWFFQPQDARNSTVLWRQYFCTHSIP